MCNTVEANVNLKLYLFVGIRNTQKLKKKCK